DVDKAMEWWTKWTSAEPQNPEAWYTIGVACWERSYKNQYLASDERRKVISQGIDALGKALQIKPEYFDALSYMNLIYREKAKLEKNEGNEALSTEDTDTADKYLKKALEVRNRQIKAEAKAG